MTFERVCSIDSASPSSSTPIHVKCARHNPTVCADEDALPSRTHKPRTALVLHAPPTGFLLGTMIDRAHEMPPHLIAPLVAEEIAVIGGRDVTVFLQDYEQMTLVPLSGRRLLVEAPVPIDGSLAGRAFLGDELVEQVLADGVRVFVPLLDGTDRVRVLAFTADRCDEHDRRLAQRFAGLLADVLVTKGMYTDRFFQARRRQPMSLSAEMQWALLPPLTMTTPQVAVAGILEPAYDVAGDSFDYALNDDARTIELASLRHTQPHKRPSPSAQERRSDELSSKRRASSPSPPCF